MDSDNSKGIAYYLSQLQINGECQDVTFKVVSDKYCVSFRAHKLVCKIWSSVFEDMFACNKDEIEITDTPPAAFEALLKFLYGSLKDVTKNQEDKKFMHDLYLASDRYKIQSLKQICCDILSKSTITVANVFQLLETAKMTEFEVLKLQCMKVLEDKTDEIFSFHDVQNISHSMVESVLKLKSLFLCSEYELLDWIYKWAEHVYKEKSMKKSDPRLPLVVIYPFLKYLNFSALNAEQFGALVNKYEVFFNSEDGFKIFMNISCPETRIDWPCWYNKDNVQTRIFTKKNQEEERESLCNNANCIASVYESDKSLDNDNLEAVSFSAACDNETIINPSETDLNETDCKSYLVNKGFMQEPILPDRPLCKELDDDCLSLDESESDSDSSEHSLPMHAISENKIKKKKVLKTYLLSERKSLSNIRNFETLNDSEEFIYLANTVWKQQRFNSIAA